MRKISLIELVSDFLAGGDAPADIRGRYHPEIISNYLSLAHNKVVFDTFMEAKSYSDYSTLDSWAKNYTAAITSRVLDTGIVTLPYPPIQLPDNKGIMQVLQSTAGTPNLSEAFAYRETTSNAIFAALEVSAISTRPTFYLEVLEVSGVNKHILRVEKVPDAITEVAVKMIVPFERLDDYDEIAIPAGKETALIGGVIDIMKSKLPADRITDNVVNQIP